MAPASKKRDMRVGSASSYFSLERIRWVDEGTELTSVLPARTATGMTSLERTRCWISEDRYASRWTPYTSLGSFRSTLGRFPIKGDGGLESHEVLRMGASSSWGISRSTTIGLGLRGSSSCAMVVRQDTPSRQMWARRCNQKGKRHMARCESDVPWPKAAMMVRRLCSVSLESFADCSPSRFLSRKPVTGVLRST